MGIEYLPFYVGKGVGDRAYNINRNESHHKKRQFIEKSGKSIQIKILKDGLTESEALMMESKLIDIFGLVSFGGWLVNLDEGINNESRKEMYMEDYMNINKMLKMVLTQWSTSCIIQLMMKTIKKSTIIKYSNLARPDEYLYTLSEWPIKVIDGVEFIYVSKTLPEGKYLTTLLMRKDSLKRV